MRFRLNGFHPNERQLPGIPDQRDSSHRQVGACVRLHAIDDSERHPAAAVQMAADLA
jgi:hypothetical protein